MYWPGKHFVFALAVFFAGAWLMFAASAPGAPAGFKELPAFQPRGLPHLTPLGSVPATNLLRLALGLPLHHREQLNALIAQLDDPRGTNYHHFLTPDDFTRRFGPTAQEYEAVVQFAEAHGLNIVGRHRNRLVLDVAGNAADVGRAFQVHLRTYQHPVEARTFFAPDTAPSVPADLPVADVWGLSDYARPKPQVVIANASKTHPSGYNGSGPGWSFLGSDFRNAYAFGSPLNGGGQTVALVEFDGYYPQDITNYEAQCGYSPVPLQNVYDDEVDGTPGFSGIGNAVLEVSLDIEMAIAMAPGLSRILVYEGLSPYDVYNSIATDDQALQISSSWTIDTGPATDWTGTGGTLDSILSEMVVQGQAFFQAAGDVDAYTGSQTLNGASGPIPVDSIYVTCVGGTSLTMNPVGASYGSENVWNWGNNTGTGGGISTNYSIPPWQAPVNMSNNDGSVTCRNIPDVAMASDNIYAVYNNGSANAVAGTSCAAPLWAGYCALINQQSIGTTPGSPGAGFLNPALYAIGIGTNYTVCFNDIIYGNNVGENTPGLYDAVPGYDLCTGWGSPAGTNLINTLAPLQFPFFITQPAGGNVFVGTNLTLAPTVSGASPIGFQWQLDGTNLTDGTAVFGSASNVLSLPDITTNETGNYTLVLTNAYGSVTSAVASITVSLVPASSTLVSSENPSGFNDDVTITADVWPTTATGTLQFYTNGAPFEPASLLSGQAVGIDLSTLPRGTNLITVVYSGDADDFAFTNTFLQLVTNHPPAATPAFFTRAAGASLVIPISDLAADWSDVDGDPVSLVGVSPSTNGVIVADDGSGILVYENSNNVPDQFECIITDGFGGTNAQTVNISVVFPGIGVIPVNPPEAGINVELTGVPGQTYVLVTATNLAPPVTWLPLATNTLGTNGVWQYTDTQSTNVAQRFYRLDFPP